MSTVMVCFVAATAFAFVGLGLLAVAFAVNIIKNGW